MEYIEEDRKQPEEDIIEVGFWTNRNKIIAGSAVVIFVVIVGVFMIGSSIRASGNDDSSSDDNNDDNTQPPVNVDAWDQISDAPEWARDALFSPDEFSHCFVDDISDQGPGVVLCWQVTTPPQSRENRGRQTNGGRYHLWDCCSSYLWREHLAWVGIERQRGDVWGGYCDLLE